MGHLGDRVWMAGAYAAVCPQRCVYQACNYEETFPHICAALGDYAYACASRGVLLWGWRSSVDNCSACFQAWRGGGSRRSSGGWGCDRVGPSSAQPS